jgi:hypothetical protein
MILVFSSFMIATAGCAPKVKYTLPPLKEQAVLKVTLPDRPELDQFTPEEMKTVPRSAHGKILKNQAAWWGYADIAEAAVKAHEDYERSIFGGDKAKEKTPTDGSPKKGWQFWK